MIAPLFLSLALLASPQEADANRSVPVLSVEELVLKYYEPKHVRATWLSGTLYELVGRSFHVRERGGYASNPVDDLFEMGSAVGVYDTAEYVDRVLAMAAELDRPSDDGAGGTEPTLETMHFVPRFLTLGQVMQAMRPFQRSITLPSGEMIGMTQVEERGLLIVRNTPERIAEIRAVLEKIDVPEAQIRITCWMISGAKDANDDANLPADLVENLRPLLPDLGFELLGYSMVQTTVALGMRRTMDLGWEDASFSFRPSAFDGETGSLTVDSCSLVQRAGTGGERKYFETSTIFRGGDYTVIGAVGAKPMFLVVRVTRG